jgi:hypothetical protein
VEAIAMTGGTNSRQNITAKYIVDTGIKIESIKPIMTGSSLKFIFLRNPKKGVDGSTNTLPFKHAS